MVERLADGVWLLDLGLFPPLATSGYLIDDGDLTLVDPGLFWNRPTLRTEIERAGYALSDLDRVLVTHWDLDHAGGLGALVPAFDGPVYLGAADLALVRGESHPPLLHHKGLFHRVARRLFPLPAGLTYRSVADGDRIGSFRAVHTPGHNPGHTVFVHDSGVAFLGDLVWGQEGGLRPPFWGDSYDMAEIRASIRAFAERAPDFEVAAMAHGEPVRSGGREALRDLAARL